LQFIYDLSDHDDVFDPTFYRHANVELFSLGDDNLMVHWRDHGKAEGRVANPRTLMNKAGAKIRDICLGFSADEYLDFSPDLEFLRGDFIAIICHYLLYGRNEKFRVLGSWQFFCDGLKLALPTTDAPIRIAPPQERVNVCVLIHVFYPEVWQELAAFARNFQNRSVDIFINVVDQSWTPELHQEIREFCPGAFVQISINAGMDIGGCARLLDNVDIDKYDVFAFMHTKKSPHVVSEQGAHWRRTLLGAIAGSPEVAENCVDTFLDQPSVGMIGAKEWRSTHMGKNGDNYEKMLDLFEITGKSRELEYLSGTMFLLRGEVVKRLHTVLSTFEWEFGGGKDLAFFMDGQLAHAVERVMPALVRQMGYEILYR